MTASGGQQNILFLKLYIQHQETQFNSSNGYQGFRRIIIIIIILET